MPDAQDIMGQVFDNGTGTMLARLIGADGDALVQADISTITYSVFLIDDQDPDNKTAAPGYLNVPLVVADVIFDTLQTDAIWTVDATGYNFLHTPDTGPSSSGGPAGEGPVFLTAGRRYLVEYTLTPASGPPIILRFRVNVI